MSGKTEFCRYMVTFLDFNYAAVQAMEAYFRRVGISKSIQSKVRSSGFVYDAFSGIR